MKPAAAAPTATPAIFVTKLPALIAPTRRRRVVDLLRLAFLFAILFVFIVKNYLFNMLF
jgi:hypothetical protein